ncbi:MAG: hypothetical protein IPN29_16520 [Saprospiraceae bacterium]|nr:hypothetical protein [Saprospiraceae bacterium]
MRIGRITTLLFFAFWYGMLPGQQVSRCGSDHHMQKYKSFQPALLQQIEDDFMPGKQRPQVNAGQRSAPIFIPVHIIVVHTPGTPVGQGNNISVSRILSQLEVLNRDFSRNNADTTHTPAVFAAGNPMIQFCMASVDPDGNPTVGITRFATNDNFDEEEFNIKSETGWPRSSYLNIWIADVEDLGYAYIPSTNSLPNAVLDGVVINYTAFGGPGSGAEAPFNLGRTATHEVGHYLGIQHIWKSSGCNSDDGFEDTPLQDDENFGCPVHPSPSCTNSGDMFMNYMDYADDACMNAFSAMQANHMRAIMMGVRSSLLFSGESMCNVAPLSAVILSSTDPECFGFNTGSIVVEALGGIPPYTFTMGTQSNQTGTFTQLSSGTYIISITDAANIQTTVSDTLNQPSALVIDSTNIVPNLCFGDSSGIILIYVSGGTAPSGKYLAAINGSAFGVLQPFTNLVNGQYHITIKDDKQCQLELTAEISSPPLLSGALYFSTISCHGMANGSIDVLLTGGRPPYLFQLDSILQDTGYFDSLRAGKYTLRISDYNGCTKLDSFFMAEPTPIATNILVKDASCYAKEDGSISMPATGGIPPYFYSIDGQNFRISPDFTDLPAGEYRALILDNNQCRTEFLVTVSQPDELIIEDIVVTESGNGSYILSAAVQGGRRPYQYYLDTISTIQSDSVFEGIVMGTHTIRVLDSAACSVEKAVVISGTHDWEEGNFKVGPNPVKDYLVIQYFGDKNEEVDLEIYDISGRLFRRENQIKFSNEKNVHNIFVSNMVNSIFIFKIASKFKSSHILLYKE